MPITEDSQGTLSRGLSRGPFTEKPNEEPKPKQNCINKDPKELQDPKWLFCSKKTFFWIFANDYMIEWVMEINFQVKILVFEDFVFMLPIP